jgi:hypothetical protein
VTWAFVHFLTTLLITFRYGADTVRALPLHSRLHRGRNTILPGDAGTLTTLAEHR